MKLKLFFLLPFFTSLVFSLFLISPVMLTNLKTPANTVNMMVGDYYEDYFEYLSFIKQGQKGNIILENLFNGNEGGKIFVPWWPYSLLGYLSFLSHLNIPPALIFWFSSAFFAFILLWLTFMAVTIVLKKEGFLRQFLAFLLIIFSSGFFNVFDSLKTPDFKIIPYAFWYSVGPPFNRYSIYTPHHQLTHIIFLLGLLFIISRIRLPLTFSTLGGYFLFSLLLLFLSPSQLLLFWLSYLASATVFLMLNKILNKQRFFLPFMVTAILLTPIAFLLYRFSLSSPTYISGRLWDVQHLYHPQISLVILTFGPLLFLFPLGLQPYFSKISFVKLLFFFVTFFSFLFVHFPANILVTNFLTFLGIHNLRFNTPNSYLLLGTSAILALQTIFKKTKGILVTSILILIYLSLSIFGSWQINSRSPYQAYALQFLPGEIYQGLTVLEQQRGDFTTLTPPGSFLGVIIPAISAKRVYIGRSILTLNLNEKNSLATKFYTFKMTATEAEEFLKKEKIDTILLTRSEATEAEFLRHYSFLQVVFKNSQLTILYYN